MKKLLIGIAIASISLSGCAGYRTSSNIKDAPSTVAPNRPIIISQDSLPGRQHTAIGPLEVTVKKLTLFHDDPTPEQANEILIEKARAIGADAVVDVTYKSGIGFTTWGYIDAKGTAVKFIDGPI